MGQSVVKSEKVDNRAIADTDIGFCELSSVEYRSAGKHKTHASLLIYASGSE